MRKFLVSALFLLSVLQVFSQAYFPIYKNELWAYIDSNGTEVIAPKFDRAGYFYDGMALAITNEKVGYINSKGDWAIPAKYDAAYNFSEGLAFILEDEDWGVVNKKGEWVIDPIYAKPGLFHDGLFKFKLERGLFSTYGFINAKGDTPIYPSFEKISDFSEGLAAASKDGSKYGYIDTKGEWIIQPAYNLGALMKIDGEYVLTDKNFSEGLVSFEKDDKVGVMDKTGKTVIEPKFASIGKFKNGLAPAKTDSLYGYIDTKGKWVIKPQFNNAEMFNEGLAAVAVGPFMEEKWGFIDTKGKIVIPITLAGGVSYTEPFLFKDGTATCYIEPGVWGYVNRAGKVIWKSK